MLCDVQLKAVIDVRVVCIDLKSCGSICRSVFACRMSTPRRNCSDLLLELSPGRSQRLTHGALRLHEAEYDTATQYVL